MTKDKVIAWVNEGESEVQEFKKSTGTRREAAASLCAMLNHRGGRVLFGVSPQGQVTGQEVSDKTLEEVVAEIDLIEPPVRPTLDRVSIGSDKEVLVVSVTRGQVQPYTYKGKAYKRVGSTDCPLTREEYNTFLLERLHGDERWENRAANSWSIDDLDATEITRTLDESIRRGRADDPGTRAVEDILRGFGLYRDRTLLRAAPVLFGKPQCLDENLPQCLLRVARFKGSDKTEFLDNRQFHGNCFDLLIKAERFLRENLPIAGRVVPNLFERVDDPLYPPVALREALANAFCHRDYSIGGGSVALAIYDDRLEITSSGILHFGLTAEDLFAPHESLPWNPLIARVFYRRGIIESWGRGTLKMAELTQQAGLPRPEIEELAGCVTVRFRPGRYVPPQRVGRDLTDRQREILSLLAVHRRLALRDFREKLEDKVIDWQLKEDLNTLKHLGMVKHWGHGRGAYWYLAQDVHKPI